MSTPTPALPSPIRNSYWVLPGKVLAGEHPTAATVEATRERLQRLIDAGVECFIDLTEPGEVKPYDPELPVSVEYLRKPIRDHGVPAQRAHMAEILDCIHDALQSGRCVYVHCRAGIGRTGTVVGCLLVERGFDGEAALDELNRLWQHCERAQSWASIPETDDQLAYVKKWKGRAVFAEELSLASLAARDALVGKSDSPPASGTGAGSAAGAGAILGVGLPPAGASDPALGAGMPVGDARGAAPGVGLFPGRASGAPSGSPTAKSHGTAPSAESAAPGLLRLGLPLLDDDDDESSDFATFNKARGLSPGTASSGGPTPVVQPGEWPSFGKQPVADSRGATPTGQGAQTGKAAPERGGPTSTRDTAKVGVASKSGAAPSGQGAQAGAAVPERGSVTSTRDTAKSDLASKSGAAPSGQGVQTGNAAPERGSPTSTRDAAKAGLASKSGAAPTGQGAEIGTAVPERGSPTSTRDTAKAGLASKSGAAPTGQRAQAGAAVPERGSPTSTRDAAKAGLASKSGAAPSRQGAQTGTAAPERGSPASVRDDANAGAAATAIVTVRSNPARDPALTEPPLDTRAPAVVTPNATSDDDPLSDPEALSAARSLRERFLGALLGLAVGDAISAATQFRKPGTFTPVGDMIGGGPYDLPRGGWSDDTAMALCLADSLLERNGFDARDQMDRYRRWQQEGYLSSTGQCVGITASVARAIAMSAWRRGALFGSHDPSQLDPEPLSRVTPAVLFFFAASGQAVEQATEAARTTCQAPAVLDACRSLARALHAALSGQPKAVVLEKAVQAIGNAPGRTATGISASAALTAAVAAFGATANFRDAVLYAANLGGDSDVISTVCGQLAGAYYSVKAIPTSWHNGLMQKELIVSYADRLLTHAMLGLSG